MAAKALKSTKALLSALPPQCMSQALLELRKSGVSFSESAMAQLIPPPGANPAWSLSMAAIGASDKKNPLFSNCDVLGIEDGFLPIGEKGTAIRWQSGAFGEDCSKVDILGLLVPVRCRVDGWERSAVLVVAAWWEVLPFYGSGREPGPHKPRPGSRIIARVALAMSPGQLAEASEAIKPVENSNQGLYGLFLSASQLWKTRELLAHDRVWRMLDQATGPGLSPAQKGPRL